jgi:transaldolase
LVADNVPVLLTAVYSSAQAIAAASIGVAYIAPYLGRLDDAGHNGLEVIAEMHSLVAGTGTHVLAASVRSSNDIVNLAAKGISMFTAAPAVLREVFQDSVSDRSAEDFEEAVSRSR